MENIRLLYAEKEIESLREQVSILTEKLDRLYDFILSKTKKELENEIGKVYLVDEVIS